MDQFLMRRLFQIGNATGVIATIVVNGLANSLPLNGRLTGELSDAYPNLFVPAGLTFAIWGVIYTLLVIFAIFQFQDFFKKDSDRLGFIHRIGWLFIVSCIGNITWIFFWHYEQVLLSLAAMLLLLLSLLGIYLRLDIGRSEVPRYEFFCVQVPFSIYLGWITVATIANVTALLVDIGWQGFLISAGLWTILILVVAVFLTCIILIKRGDIFYSLVVLWALLGIALKRFSSDVVFGVREDIGYTAVIGMVVISVVVVYELFLKLRHKRVLKD